MRFCTPIFLTILMANTSVLTTKFTWPKGFNIYANFSGWDIYRCEVQLLAMLFPKESSDMVTSLVLAAQQGGGLARMARGEQ